MGGGLLGGGSLGGGSAGGGSVGAVVGGGTTGGNGGVGVVRSGSAGGVTLSLSLTALDGAEPRDYYSWYAAIDSDRTYHMRVTEYNTILPVLKLCSLD